MYVGEKGWKSCAFLGSRIAKVCLYIHGMNITTPFSAKPLVHHTLFDPKPRNNGSSQLNSAVLQPWLRAGNYCLVLEYQWPVNCASDAPLFLGLFALALIPRFLLVETSVVTTFLLFFG